jgi:hypothetical protein
MNPQNQDVILGERLHTHSAEARRRLHPSEYTSLPQISASKTKEKSLSFKVPKTIKNMKTNESIHDYEQRLERARRVIKQLPNGKVSLQFLAHISALGLLVGRVSKYAAHLPVLLRIIDNVDLKTITKTDLKKHKIRPVKTGKNC